MTTRSSRTTSRAAQAARTRRRVLEVAGRQFAEKGYAATSLQGIADAMGVTKANVYYYFRTKDAILVALLDQRVSGLEALVERAEREPDEEARATMLLEGFVDEVVIAHRNVGSVDFADPAIRGLPEINARLDALSERVSRMIFGTDPTPAQAAGFAMLLDLKPALRALTSLPDDELRSTLVDMCRRLLDLPH